MELLVYNVHSDLYVIDIMLEMTQIGRLWQWWAGHVMTEEMGKR